MVGIKGTGMAALAEVLLARGAVLTGSDTAETFYTDRILRELGLAWREGFHPGNVPQTTQLVIHSAAYSREEHPELVEARRRGVPLLSYPQALGRLSEASDSSGVAGTHGKTTTTAMAGTVLKALGLPATIVAGSEVADFGGRSALVLGERFLVAETCEYRRHFLFFRPRRIVITGVEPDHLDYFHGLPDVLEAFTAYGGVLPRGGTVLFNSDDPGAAEVVRRLRARGAPLRFRPYGLEADGPYRLEEIEQGQGRVIFRLAGMRGVFSLGVPGRHAAYDAAAAVALAADLLETSGRSPAGAEVETVREALRSFRGSRRRSEVVGTAGGVLFVDDYGHHPTEIRTTLEGLRTFHTGRRLVVDFMPHTYSRTEALLEDFALSFAEADLLVLHRIYASAREKAGSVSGQTLYQEVRRRRAGVAYFEEPSEAEEYLAGALRPGDLFVTMGAGDNWKLGRRLMERLKGLERSSP